MRLVLLIIIVGIAQVFAANIYSQETRISLNLENTSIRSVLEQIEDQSEFYFIYNAKAIDVDRKVNVEFENKSIPEILNKLFEGTNVVYKIDKRQIVISTNFAANNIQQNITISGKVIDSSGAPLPGVTVIIKSTTQGTITNANGEYSISNVPADAILQFSFVGMKNQEIPIVNKTKIDVTMVEETIGLEEVVAIGYGSVRKSDITGAVSSLKRENILSNPSSNTIESIQGKVPGVDIYLTDAGRPGAQPSIRVRGNRSIKATNEPLYVVDGIPFAGNIGDINSAEIESIEILKDASATAIYGSRGANGVILVQTRRGGKGKVTINLDSYYGIQENNELKMMSAEKWVDCRRWAMRNIGKYPMDEQSFELDSKMFYVNDPGIIESLSAAYDENGNYDPSKIRTYDWLGLISRTGRIQEHQVNVMGGGDKTRASLFLGYFDNVGGIKGFNYNKYSIRSTIDQEINKWLKIGGSTGINFSTQNECMGAAAFGSVGTVGNSVYQVASGIPRLIPFLDENGNRPIQPGNDFTPNPELMLENDLLENKRILFNGSYYTEVNLPLGIRYKLNFGFDYLNTRTGVFNGEMGSKMGSINSAASKTARQSHFVLDNLLYYERNFKDIHRLEFTIGNSIEELRYESFEGSVSDLPYEYQKWNNLSTATNITSLDSDYSQWRLNSFMGRINYVIKDKYLFTATGRADGSSRLAEGNKYTFFPSVAIGWQLAEEPFMSKFRFLDNLKLRGGYGETGNTSIDPYSTLGLLSRTVYASDDSAFLGYAPSELANTSLTWEQTSQFNIGLDFGILKQKLSGNIDIYRQNTTNLLLPRQLPIASGFSSITQNIGATRNTGVEINLSGIIMETASGFKWNADAMFSKNKEEIVELYAGKVDDIGNSWFIGYPINTYYNYKFDGIWQDTPEDLALMAEFNSNGANYTPGDIRLYDRDNNKKVTADDRMILGYAVPKWIGSLNSKMEYKGFDFSFFIFTRQGQMVYESLGQGIEARYLPVDVPFWTPENKSNEWPKPMAGMQTPYNMVARFYKDGSFVKLKNVTLGYTLSPKVLSKVYMSKLRIYVLAKDLYVHHNLLSVDPESLNANLPTPKTYMVGISASF